MTSPDFSTKLHKAQAGDESAFEDLFHQAASPLHYYCDVRLGRRLREHCEPIDVVQETYLHAFDSIDSLQCEEWKPFMCWLYKIAENRIRSLSDHVGAAKRTPPGDRVTASGALDRLRVSLTGPATAAERSEQQERLREALFELDDEMRAAAVLHYYHDATGADIAESLGVSETTARRLLGRALRHLGERLTPR